MASANLAKIESLLYREITLILQKDFNDPKLGFVTVSEVRVSPDLSHAKVFVSFLGKKERNDAGLKVLNNAKGYVRSQCAKKMKLHKVPELHFVIDESLQEANRIEEIIHKISQESNSENNQE